MPTVDWRPAWDTDFGFATAPTLPPITRWLRKADDGRIYAGDDEFVFVGAHAHESACGLDDASERIGLPKRVAAKGATCLRMLGFNNKVAPAGPWTPGSGGNVAVGDTCTDATFLASMDETIYNLNNRGVRVWIAFDHGDKARKAAALPRNVQEGSSTHSDAGMVWSEQWMQCYEAHIALFMDRVNTFTGIAYKNNPGIAVWQSLNESAIADCFDDGNLDDIVNEVGGTGGGAGGGSGYWRAELDSLLAAWAVSNSWTVPGTRFPLHATYTGWGASDKAKMVEFIYYLEARAASRLRAFIKARSPNCLFVYTQSSYCDSRVNAYYSDIVGRDSYAYMGLAPVVSPPYVTRSSSLSDPDAFFTGAGKFEERSRTYHIDGGANSVVEIETGQYTQNRWDATTCLMAAVMHNLQQGQGYFSLSEGQSRFQSAAVGIQLPHILAGWPSRKLGEIAAGLIMRHRMIGALSTTLTYVVDPAAIPPQVASTNRWCCTGYRFGANINNGGEWHWLKRRIATDYGTPAMTTPYTSINDAAITAGVTLTTADGLKGTLFFRGNAGVPLMTFAFPSVVGQSEMVDNRTTGLMQVSGLAAAYAGQCLLVSMGDYPLGSGDMLLFVHGASYMTDMTIDNNVGGTTTEDRFVGYDGNNITVSGTEAQTRLWVPPSHTVALTLPRDCYVSGVTQTGTLAAPAVSPTYVGGVLTVTTDVNYPVYKVSPKAAAAVRTRRRVDARG